MRTKRDLEKSTAQTLMPSNTSLRRVHRKTSAPGAPFRAAEHLRNEAEIALYIQEILADGDACVAPVMLRTVADALGGMVALAERPALVARF